MGGEGDDLIGFKYSYGSTYWPDISRSGNIMPLGFPGRDSIDAGNGNDQVWCDDGNDTVSGGLGADTLQGGKGDDNISGGNGVDILYGNEGNDAFIFFLGDSGTGSGRRDIIKDFDIMSTSEVIDLHDLVATSLIYKGSSPFDGQNQVRYVMDVSSNSTIVQINIDANLVPEMEIELTGLMGLQATDFILSS